MHLHNLLTPLLVLAVLLAGVAGGAYFYSIGQEDDIILELTFEQLKTLEKPDKVSFDATTPMTIVSADPSVAPQEIALMSSVAGSVTEDRVSVTVNGVAQEFTVDEFLATNPFGDVDVWLDEINAGNYTVEETGEGDEAMWVYTFDSEALEQSYLNTLSAQLQAVAAAGLNGATMLEPVVSYDGNMSFVVEISSKTNVIQTMDITTDAPIVLSFSIDAGLETVIETQVSFEDLSTSVVYTEFTLQDGQTIPTNPLLVLIASYM